MASFTVCSVISSFPTTMNMVQPSNSTRLVRKRPNKRKRHKQHRRKQNFRPLGTDARVSKRPKRVEIFYPRAPALAPTPPQDYLAEGPPSTGPQAPRRAEGFLPPGRGSEAECGEVGCLCAWGSYTRIDANFLPLESTDHSQDFQGHFLS